MKVKPNIKQENTTLARTARQAIAKSHLDISELSIACSGGAIELYGKVKMPRDHTGDFDMRREFESLKNMIRAVRGVREVHGEKVKMFT